MQQQQLVMSSFLGSKASSSCGSWSNILTEEQAVMFVGFFRIRREFEERSAVGRERVPLSSHETGSSGCGDV